MVACDKYINIHADRGAVHHVSAGISQAPPNNTSAPYSIDCTSDACGTCTLLAQSVNLSVNGAGLSHSLRLR